MRLPFVSRGRYDDLRERLADKDAQIAELKRERSRLYDLFARNALGGQINDTIPVEAQATAASDAPMSPAEREQVNERARLQNIARYHPSQLGKELEKKMVADVLLDVERAHAAPPEKIAAAENFFEGARKEAVTTNGNGNH